MFEILVAVDDNESRARAQAESVATVAEGRDDVTAVVGHVFTDNPTGASVHQLSAVRRAREHLESAGVDVELFESSGDPVTEILDYAERRDVDVISVAGRARSPAGKAILGSVSQQVLLGADRPVLFTTAETDEE